MRNRSILLAAALALAAAPVVAQPPLAAPDAGPLDKLLESCRAYVEIAYRSDDVRGFNSYVERLLKYPRHNRDEIVACGAYVLGAMDMAEGRVVPSSELRRP